MDGKKLTDEQVKKSKSFFDGKNWVIVTPHQSRKKIVVTVTKVDTNTTPKQIHWVRVSGPNAGKTIRGIYRFDGDDQRTICYDPSGNVIPKGFFTKKGSGHVRHTLKRVKE